MFIIRNIYHIHIVCEQHNLFYGRFLLSTAQKVHTTWVTVNKHGGSTPRGKKWTTCVSSWLGLPLVCALCIHLLWKLCKWSWKCIDQCLNFAKNKEYFQCDTCMPFNQSYTNVSGLFHRLTKTHVAFVSYFYLKIFIGYVVSVCSSYG